MSPEQARAYGIIDEVYAERTQSLISEAKQSGALAGEGAAVEVGEHVTPVEPREGIAEREPAPHDTAHRGAS